MHRGRRERAARRPDGRAGRVGRRLVRWIGTGLMYCAVHAWPTSELIAALRATSNGSDDPPPDEPDAPGGPGGPGRPEVRGEHAGAHPERVVPLASLPDAERQALLDLERMLEQGDRD